jgi:Domain of Unknown Function (DUF1080)
MPVCVLRASSSTGIAAGISLSLGCGFVTLGGMLIRIIALIYLLTLPVRAVELVLNFGDAGAEQSPAGFTNVFAGEGQAGLWLARADESLGATSNVVLTPTRKNLKDEYFSMCVYQREKFDDFTLTTKFKIVDGLVEQMAGIVFRFQDEKNFYVIRASALGNNLRFYKVVAGIRSQPIGPALEMKLGEWHELKIECRGNKIRSWLNGREAIPELTDTSFAVGKIGFWTKSDSVCRFADTRVNYTPREPFAAVLVRDSLKTNPRLLGLKIYVNDEKGEPRIIASKDDSEVGAAGGDSERGAIAGGHVFYGREKDSVSVVQPLRDRNGEPIAAVRVVMRPYPGQIEQAVLQRANPIVKEMQFRVQSLEELR